MSRERRIKQRQRRLEQLFRDAVCERILYGQAGRPQWDQHDEQAMKEGRALERERQREARSQRRTRERRGTEKRHRYFEAAIELDRNRDGRT